MRLGKYVWPKIFSNKSNKYSAHCFWFNTVDIIKIDFEESQFYFTGNSPKIPSISITLENLKTFPAGIYLFKVNNRNTRTRSETCSKLTIKKTLEWCRRSGAFFVNFEHISHLVLMFLLLTLKKQLSAGFGFLTFSGRIKKEHWLKMG